MAEFVALQKNYTVTEVLGEGGSALVVRACRKSDMKDVAVKVVRRSMRSMIETEVEILSHISSDRVTKLIEVVEDAKFTYMVMECMEGGDLWGELSRRDEAFGERDALRIVESILEGLVYLHSRGIAHRDIKIENLMLADGDDITSAKLVDFGLARWRKTPLVGQFCSEVVGTPQYLPPQIAAKKPYVPEQADMWSLGVVLYVLISGSMPFAATRLDALFRSIRTREVSFDGPVWEEVSNRTRDLVRDLLSKNPSQRPTAARCLETLRAILNGADMGPAPVCQPTVDGFLGGFVGAFMGAFNLNGAHSAPVAA